jgi:hypothetical protein
MLVFDEILDRSKAAGRPNSHRSIEKFYAELLKRVLRPINWRRYRLSDAIIDMTRELNFDIVVWNSCGSAKGHT